MFATLLHSFIISKKFLQLPCKFPSRKSCHTQIRIVLLFPVLIEIYFVFLLYRSGWKLSVPCWVKVAGATHLDSLLASGESTQTLTISTMLAVGFCKSSLLSWGRCPPLLSCWQFVMNGKWILSNAFLFSSVGPLFRLQPVYIVDHFGGSFTRWTSYAYLE